MYSGRLPFLITPNCVSVQTKRLVHESHLSKIVVELENAVQNQFGPNIEHSKLGRMDQESHAECHVKMLREVESVRSGS